MSADPLDPLDPIEEPAVARAWQPRPWWAWHLAAIALGLAVVGAGGAQLADADLGTNLRARACDTAALGGLLLLTLGGAVLVAGLQLTRLQHPAAVLGLDWRSALVALPVPALLLALTLPGAMGCALGGDIADLALVGPALVGAPGLVIAGFAAALVGAALAGVVHVTWQAPVVGVVDEPPGIVELAIREAEALEMDAAAQRFHGVD